MHVDLIRLESLVRFLVKVAPDFSPCHHLCLSIHPWILEVSLRIHTQIFKEFVSYRIRICISVSHPSIDLRGLFYLGLGFCNKFQPYLAGESALLQQLRQNWIEASDWRPRGGGIMTMNNQGFEESNMGFEEFMEMTTCFYFPPSSPTYFPLYRPMPSVFVVSADIQYISLALSCQHILEDKSGALHVINREDGDDIIDLLYDGVASYVENKFGDLNQIARAAGLLPEDVELFVDNILDEASYETSEVTLRRINWLEQHDEDIVDQPVFELASVMQQLIQNRDGELDVIFGGGDVMINGQEIRDTQGLPTTLETLLICQFKLSYRVWLGHGGQWAGEIRCRLNRLNIGSFTTVEDAVSAYEMVIRWSGWTDLTSNPVLFKNENRSKLPPQLLPLALKEKPSVDFGLVCCNATGNDEIEAVGIGSAGTGDCVMADQARLNSGCLGKRKTNGKNPGGEKRNKKTNGVKIAIPLEDISQTKGMRLKDAANHLRVSRSAQLNPDTLPSDQALAATIDTNSVVVKEIVAPLFLPIARQENLDEDFGNGVEAVGMGSERTGESETEDGQLNSWYLGKGKRKKMTPRGERRNKKTNGVRMTKEMLLKDPAKHLKGGEREAEPEPEAAEDEAADAAAGNAAHILVAEAIPLEDIPQTKGVCLKDAAMNLNVSRSTQLNSDTLPSDQTLAATIDTNNAVVKETVPPLFLPTAQQENLDEDLGNGVAAVGMGSERTRDSETEDEFNPVSRSRQLNPDTLSSDQALAATIDTNSAVEKEIVPPLLLPTAQQENLDEDFGNGVEAVGMGSERTEESETEDEFNTVSRSTNGRSVELQEFGERKREKMNPRGERRNKKTNGVRIAIPLEDVLQTKEMLLKDAAKHLKVSIPELRSSYREYGIPKWPPRNEHKLIRQSLPNETPSVVDQEEFPQLTSHNGPSDQALPAIVDTNTDKEIPLPQLLPTTQQENPDAGFGNDAAEAIGMGSEKTGEGVMEEGQLNSGCSGKKGKRKVNAAGVKIEITKEDILKVKGMRLNDAAEHLEVSRSTLKRACRENGIKRWPPRKGHELIGQTRPNESLAVEHELISQTRPYESLAVEHELISQTCPNESLAVEHELISQTRPTRPNESLAVEHELISQTRPNESPAVEHELVEHELISQTRPNESPTIEHELISQTRPNESPTIEHELISQTHLNKSLVVVVDQEQTPQLNPDMFLPSNQVSTTIDTKSVKLKARYEGSTITFRLSQPLRKVELEQEVKKRLPLEAGTYNISYKDEDDDLVLIACDDDLEECISSSTPLGSRCHELFLMRK